MAFLDEYPHLFRYLHVYDEFLLEVGPALNRAGHLTEHHALLVRLRNEQPEVYAECFGYWDFDLLADALRAGRPEDIPACLTLFRQQPIRFIDEFAQVVDLLAWHGCETELRGLLEPTAARIADSPEVIQGDFGLRWLTTLAMVPVLELGDVSPESLERLCDQVMAVEYFSDEPDNRDWLRRAARMALPTEAGAALDLNQAHSAQFVGDVAWSFAGWLHRTKGCRWTSARFLAENMLNYWDWAEDPARGRQKPAKKTAKKGPKAKASAAFGLDGKSLRDFLNDYCVGFFGVRTLAALSTLQAFHYFTEYLVARDHLDSERASELQEFPKRDFALVLKGAGEHDPGFRIYPTYEALISGPMNPGE